MTVVVASRRLPSPGRAAIGAERIVAAGESIQAALDAAQPGDTIFVRPGTYREQLVATTPVVLRAWGATLVPPDGATAGPCDPDRRTGVCLVVATARDAAGAPHFEIDGLAIRGFPGAGLIADSTDNLVLRHVESADNALYGLHVRFARRPHIEGTFVHGNQDTSVFLLGVDGARVRRSRVENNRGEGVIFLETAQSTARRNDLRGNCTGVSVVDLGLVPGTSEGNVAAQNRMRANDNFCPENQNGAGNPSFSGIGVLVAGAVGTQVRFNDVAEHQASAETDLPPGGIVVIASAPQGGRDSGATDVGRNHLRDDGPFDLLWDGTGIGVTFSGNRCATSAPDGLCGAGE